MKPVLHKFRKPVKVLQVFRNNYDYGKEAKSFSQREELAAWKPMKSISGFVENGLLQLPESILGVQNFSNCDLIILDDDIHFAENPQNKLAQNICFDLQHPRKVYIFEIKQAENALELFLNYTYFSVGAPSRQNFKICELRPNEPVEIKINGKLDHTLTWTRARLFMEQLYIFQLLGQFDSCNLLKPPYLQIVKNIPGERREINLLKPLW